MFRLKSLCSLCLILGIFFLDSCKKKVGQRYISETDTTYSADIRHVSKKINLDPSNPELYYRRANTFFFEDNFKQATLDIEYAITLDSSNALYHFSRGSYLMSGDTANAREAEISYKKAITLKPDFLDAITNLAKL